MACEEQSAILSCVSSALLYTYEDEIVNDPLRVVGEWQRLCWAHVNLEVLAYEPDMHQLPLLLLRLSRRSLGAVRILLEGHEVHLFAEESEVCGTMQDGCLTLADKPVRTYEARASLEPA